MPGEYLDLTSEPDPAGSQRPDARPFIGIRFACCEVYSRIYVNLARTAYEGRCPRCLRSVAIKIGPNGSSSRFFTAQ